MKARHIVIVVVLAALAAGAAVFAAGDGPRGRGGMRGAGLGDWPFPMGRMLACLDLTDEQRTRIDAILDEQRPAVQALRDRLREGRETFLASQSPTQVDEAAIRAHVAAQAKIMADLEVAVARMRAGAFAVLTPEQAAQAERMRTRRMERVGRHCLNRSEL